MTILQAVLILLIWRPQSPLPRDWYADMLDDRA